MRQMLLREESWKLRSKANSGFVNERRKRSRGRNEETEKHEILR